MTSIAPIGTGLVRDCERILLYLLGYSQVRTLLRAAAETEFAGIPDDTEEPLASCDFNHDSRSGIVDAGQVHGAPSLRIKGRPDD